MAQHNHNKSPNRCDSSLPSHKLKKDRGSSSFFPSFRHSLRKGLSGLSPRLSKRNELNRSQSAKYIERPKKRKTREEKKSATLPTSPRVRVAPHGTQQTIFSADGMQRKGNGESVRSPPSPNVLRSAFKALTNVPLAQTAEEKLFKDKRKLEEKRQGIDIPKRTSSLSRSSGSNTIQRRSFHVSKRSRDMLTLKEMLAESSSPPQSPSMKEKKR